MQTAAQTAQEAVSAADLAVFERIGYLVVRGLLTPDEVQRMRQRADELVAPEREYSQANRARRKAQEQAYAASGAGRGVVA
ncbi:MAG TPA: phytanoyl-CoA dioxygenase family protein, partial [Chloroflexota bacterium]|nr:phytanoyl-CoA dioxygenase family protein [Chloroflexota bacterium]